jgi:hypothetical protein
MVYVVQDFRFHLLLTNHCHSGVYCQATRDFLKWQLRI